MTPEERAGIEAAKRAGEEAAALLTVEERARRFRAVCLFLLGEMVPPAFQRLPRAEIARISDAKAAELAEAALALLLAPGETA